MATAAHHATVLVEGRQLAEYSNLHLALRVSIFHCTLSSTFVAPSVTRCFPQIQFLFSSYKHTQSISSNLHDSSYTDAKPRVFIANIMPGQLKWNVAAPHQTSLIYTAKVSGVITLHIHTVFWSCNAPHGTNQNWVRASKYQKRSLINISLYSSSFAFCQIKTL